MQALFHFYRALGAFGVAVILIGGFAVMPIERLEAAPAVQADAQILVNVNQATFDELQAVRGIGPSLAQRIVDYRQENGAFQTLDDLSHVRGIGGAKLQKIKSQISI